MLVSMSLSVMKITSNSRVSLDALMLFKGMILTVYIFYVTLFALYVVIGKGLFSILESHLIFLRRDFACIIGLRLVHAIFC
mgnify:CR=1 FL=1